MAINAHAPPSQAGDVVYHSAPSTGSTYDALAASGPAMPIYSVPTTSAGAPGGGASGSGIQRNARKGSTYLGFEGDDNTEA